MRPGADNILPSIPHAPLALPVIAVSAGILFDDAVGQGPVPYSVGLALAAGLFAWPAARRLSAKRLLLLAGFCAGGLLHHWRTQRAPDDHVVTFTEEAPVTMRLRGTVSGEPHVPGLPTSIFAKWWAQSDRTRFLLDVHQVDTREGWRSARGLVIVTVKSAALGLSAGDLVEALGACYRPQPPDNPGQTDWSLRERRRGVLVGMSCQHRECVKILASGRDARWRAWTRLRARARALLLGNLLAEGDPEGTLLDTMILGRRTAIDPRLNEAFLKTGLTHYLAVSGLNVAILAVLAWSVGRGLGAGTRASAVLVSATVVSYAWMTDPLPPIQRATLMTLVVCASMLLGRPRNFLNSLSLAAIFILVVSPAALFDAGFQLSFAAILGIVYLTGPLARTLETAAGYLGRAIGLNLPTEDESDLFIRSAPESRGGRWLRRCARGVAYAAAVSVAASVATLPITLVHFGRVSPWGWLNTLIVAPLVSFLMAAGPAKLILAMAWPTVAGWLTWPVERASAFLVWIVEWLATWPGTNLTASEPPHVWVVAFYAAILALIVRRRSRHGGAVALGLCTIALLATAAWRFDLSHPRGLTMAVLSVGRGTAIVLELPDGRALLYDAGTSGAYDPGKSTIAPYLRHRGLRTIEAIFISHPNLDHFGGLPTVLDNARAGPVFFSPQFHGLCEQHEAGRALLEDLDRRGHPVRVVSRGDAPLRFGGVEIEVLWPPAGPAPELAANDTSLVLRVSYGGRAILLTGDIESAAQRRLLHETSPRADVLVLPHHGAVCDSTADFVASVGAERLISSTFTRTADRGPKYAQIIGRRRHFSTADVGAIIVTLHEEGITVQSMRTAPQSGATVGIDEAI